MHKGLRFFIKATFWTVLAVAIEMAVLLGIVLWLSLHSLTVEDDSGDKFIHSKSEYGTTKNKVKTLRGRKEMEYEREEVSE